MNPQNYLIPILELYCEWLNRWVYAEDQRYRAGLAPSHVYELHQFLVTDPERGLHGGGEVIAVVPGAGSNSSAFPRFMVVARVTDGDEGGGHDLTAWFELADDNTSTIVSMVQGFDTNMQFIYEDHHFLNLPPGDQR